MLPAGKYYVGDLCYVMRPEWNEVCDIVIDGSKCTEGEFSLKDGRKFAMYNTKWGDGIYYDDYNNKYPVDTGSIGCIRIEDISEKELENIKSGCIHIFENDIESYSKDGIIHFNHIVINTKSEDSDDYYDDHDYENDFED